MVCQCLPYGKRAELKPSLHADLDSAASCAGLQRGDGGDLSNELLRMLSLPGMHLCRRFQRDCRRARRCTCLALIKKSLVSTSLASCSILFTNSISVANSNPLDLSLSIQKHVETYGKHGKSSCSTSNYPNTCNNWMEPSSPMATTHSPSYPKWWWPWSGPECCHSTQNLRGKGWTTGEGD